MTIKLSETLLSVFETDVIEPAEDPAGFDLDEEETAAYQTLAAAIDWDRGCLDTSAWTSADCEVVWGLLVDLANSYDDALEHNEPPDLDRRFAARARNGLSTLSIKLSSLAQQAQVRKPRASKGGAWRKQQIEFDLAGRAVRVDAEVRGNWAVHKTLGARPGDYAVTLLPDGLLVRTFSTGQGWVAPKHEAKRRVDELLMLAAYPELEHATADKVRAMESVVVSFLWGNE